jgi:hypothetical protein
VLLWILMLTPHDFTNPGVRCVLGCVHGSL